MRGFRLPDDDVNFPCPYGVTHQLAKGEPGDDSAEAGQTHKWVEISAHGQHEKRAHPASVHETWPSWAEKLAELAISEDAGLGDVVRRYAAKAGGEWFKKFMKSIGINCGCTNRQKWLNEKYPLPRQAK